MKDKLMAARKQLLAAQQEIARSLAVEVISQGWETTVEEEVEKLMPYVRDDGAVAVRKVKEVETKTIRTALGSKILSLCEVLDRGRCNPVARLDALLEQYDHLASIHEEAKGA